MVSTKKKVAKKVASKSTSAKKPTKTVSKTQTSPAVVKPTIKRKAPLKIVRVSDEQGQADKVIVDDTNSPVVTAVVDKSGVVIMTPVDTNKQSR